MYELWFSIAISPQYAKQVLDALSESTRKLRFFVNEWQTNDQCYTWEDGEDGDISDEDAQVTNSEDDGQGTIDQTRVDPTSLTQGINIPIAVAQDLAVDASHPHPNLESLWIDGYYRDSGCFPPVPVHLQHSSRGAPVSSHRLLRPQGAQQSIGQDRSVLTGTRT